MALKRSPVTTPSQPICRADVLARCLESCPDGGIDNRIPNARRARIGAAVTPWVRGCWSWTLPRWQIDARNDAATFESCHGDNDIPMGIAGLLTGI